MPGVGLWPQKAKGHERASLGDENVLHRDYGMDYITVLFKIDSNCTLSRSEIMKNGM